MAAKSNAWGVAVGWAKGIARAHRYALLSYGAGHADFAQPNNRYLGNLFPIAIKLRGFGQNCLRIKENYRFLSIVLMEKIDF
ncbi:MAG: hypothetical protein HC866_11560 [Leptolyngbyaceae cyanobacterium RU_5_1]|nr:hypothetical protein [Leptolyngbyaceae cyanobacterium RU_5_1]